MTVIQRLQLDDKDPVRVNSAINQLAELSDLRRTVATANVNLFVNSATGSDTTNDGLSAGKPFKTIQKAVNQLLYHTDMVGFTGNVVLADGTYTDHVTAGGVVPGLTLIFIGGAAGHGASVLWQVPLTGSAIGLYVKDFCAVELHDVTMSGTDGTIAVSAEQDGILDIGTGVTFGSNGTSGVHVYVQEEGHVNFLASYSITGNANYHLLNQGGKLLYGSGITVTGSAGLTINNFIYSYGAGRNLIPSGFTASGFSGLTGAKGVIYGGANILVNGIDPDTFIPGVANLVYGGGLANNGGNLAGGGFGAFQIIGYAIGVDFNTGNADTPIKMNVPFGYTRAQGIQIIIYGATHSLTTATFGIFTATGGGGTAIQPAGTAITLSATADITANNCHFSNAFSGNNNITTAIVAPGTTWQFRVGTAEGATAVGSVVLYARILP